MFEIKYAPWSAEYTDEELAIIGRMIADAAGYTERISSDELDETERQINQSSRQSSKVKP